MQIYTTYIPTPLGELFAAANQKNLVYLQFYEEDKIVRQFPYYLKKQNPELHLQETKLLKALKIQLNEYFAQERKTFDIPTEYFGTSFQQKIWNTLPQVLYGTKLSYTEFANVCEEAGKARAVAYAISRNPILIINPCHRIIGSNGSLTGYAGRIWRKNALLELEGAIEQLSLL